MIALLNYFTLWIIIINKDFCRSSDALIYTYAISLYVPPGLGYSPVGLRIKLRIKITFALAQECNNHQYLMCELHFSGSLCCFAHVGPSVLIEVTKISLLLQASNPTEWIQDCLPWLCQSRYLKVAVSTFHLLTLISEQNLPAGLSLIKAKLHPTYIVTVDSHIVRVCLQHSWTDVAYQYCNVSIIGHQSTREKKALGPSFTE